jgi:capsular exopolysaccharide synthesis family protein
VVFVLGAICAGGAGVGMYYLAKDDFTATATIRISLKPEQLLFATPGATQASPEIFKATQRQTVYLPAVLENAMGRAGRLSILVEQSPDQLQWLRSVLKVSFRDESEYMDISLTCTNADEAKILVNSIADAYYEIASDEEKKRQVLRTSNLNRSFVEIQDEIRRKREQLKGLDGALGGSDPKELTREQQLALEQLKQIDDSIFALGFEIRNLDIDIAAAEAAANAPAEPSPEQPEQDETLDPQLELLLRGDQTLQEYKDRIELAHQKIERYKVDLAPKKAQPFIEFEEEQIRKFEQEIETHRQLLIEDFQLRVLAAGRTQSGPSLKADRERKKIHLNDWLEQRKTLLEQVPELAQGETSVEADLLRADIARSESLANALGRAIQENKIENGTAEPGSEPTPRIGKPMQAIAPRSADRTRKYLKCGAAGGFAWVLAGALVVTWDMRKRRLNTPTDVLQQLGMPVIGSLPLLKRSRRGDNATSGRLAEAVDGIAASLLCRNDGKRRQIVQISSASPGEGKSTLAANLATSLAAAGRNTLLIDFDLRRPMLHKVYEVELGPGVSEILTGAGKLHEALQASTNDNLTLLTAGHWRQKGLGALTDARIEQLFQECRERFEFVIVDTSPVLPVVDGRLVSRHVDGVIISLLRDVSEVPKVGAACQMLESFGAPIMGGVMIGSSHDVYYAYPYGQLPQKTA